MKAGCIAALAVFLSAGSAGAGSLMVTIDTSSIVGTTGNIDFEFNPGLNSQSATAQIVNFTGGTLQGSPTTFGPVLGALPGSLSLSNSAPNDYFQGILFGNTEEFLLSITGPAVASPDPSYTSTSVFGVALYDSSGTNPLLTTDPDGFAGLATVNLDGTITPYGFPSAVGQASVVTFASVPEPGSWLSTLSGASALLAAVGIARRRRNFGN